LTKAAVGLGNVDNTSDVNKPVSTAQAAALSVKADTTAVVAAVAAHEAAADPHPGYLTAAEGNAAYATAAQGALAASAIQPGNPALSDSREWSADTISQAEAEAGTATTRRAFTALRVFQAIASWWNGSAAKTKLDGIASSATANSSDATLLNRANHTGTQLSSTISDLNTVLAGYQPVDSDLTALAALSTTSYGRSLLALADAAAGRTALGLGGAATLDVGTTADTVAAGDDNRIPQFDPLYQGTYLYAVSDSQDRIGFAIKDDGTLVVGKAIETNVSGNAATATSATRVNYTGGDSQAFEELYTETIEWAVVDSDNRIALGINKSGALVIPLVQSYVTFGQAHGTSGLYSVVVDGSGRAQIQLGGNNAVVTLTAEGNNWAPVVTAETPQRIAFQSDRVDGVRYWAMNSDGTRQARAIPDKNDITFWGDSMTQRLQTYNHLPGLLSGRTITYNALGGTTVEHIIARQGGENATCTIPSGSIPASGAVALRNVWPSLGYHAGTLTVGSTYSYLVTIAGVQGTLTSTTNANGQADYTFTRSSAGAAVSVTGPLSIAVLSNITQGSFGFSKTNTAVFWLGTNSLRQLPSSSYDPAVGAGVYLKSPATTYDPTNSAAVQASTEALAQALINRVENLDRHILIVGGFIGEGQNWSSITEKTAMVAGFSTFSKYWYDLRSDFIATCKTWLQTNHPSVYANWATTDDTHIASGASPPILREDGIHLNTYGSQLASQLIASRLSSKQW
jgi:hypothetical protein